MDYETAHTTLSQLHSWPASDPMWDALAHMSDGARDFVVQTRSRAALHEAGLPSWVGVPADARGAARMALAYADDAPAPDRETAALFALREAGVATVVDVPDRVRRRPMGQLARMAEAWADNIAETDRRRSALACDDLGVPLRREPDRLPRKEYMHESGLIDTAALVDAGVPLREAAAASSAGALMRGGADDDELQAAPHELVAALDRVVGPNHPDRGIVDRLKARGAALSKDEIHETTGLVLAHARAIKQAAQRDEEPMREAAQAFADAGFTATRLNLPAPAEASTDPRALLAELGIPLKAGHR